MPDYWQFWIGLIAGGIVGGGSITLLFYKALVERLREVFQTKEAAAREVAEADEQFSQLERSVKIEGEQIRRDLQTGIGSVGAQIAAQSAAHGREISLLTDIMQESKQAAKLAQDISQTALHRTELNEQAVESIREMIQVRLKAMEEKWDQRLRHIENLLMRRDKVS